MSYILDALRRADSERERGGVPSLHSKPALATLADHDEEVGRSRSQHLLWAVIGLLALAVIVLAWQFFAARAPEPVPLSSAVPVAAVTPDEPTSIAPARDPLSTGPILAAPVAVAPRPVLVPAPAGQRKPQREPVKQASAPEPERPALAYNELPEHIRRELPQLVIGGAMYSQTRANRMLILNGQVFHEGDKVAGELVLEQIKLKSAVLAYKGYHYGISY